jgi:hypothetical protein
MMHGPRGDRRSRPRHDRCHRTIARVDDDADQLALFADPLPPPAAGLPAGWDYRAEFIDAAEEAALVAWIETLPLEEARCEG